MISANKQAAIFASPFISKNYAKWLWLCAGLFAVRVIVQAMSLVFPSDFLPSFEAWHGGVLSYPALLSTQILILLWLVWAARQLSLNRTYPNARLGISVTLFAGVYFTIMLLRLILGLTVLSDHRWFASYLPAFFHLVLAGYLFLYGHFHLRHGRKQ